MSRKAWTTEPSFTHGCTAGVTADARVLRSPIGISTNHSGSNTITTMRLLMYSRKYLRWPTICTPIRRISRSVLRSFEVGARLQAPGRTVRATVSVRARSWAPLSATVFLAALRQGTSADKLPATSNHSRASRINGQIEACLRSYAAANLTVAMSSCCLTTNLTVCLSNHRIWRPAARPGSRYAAHR